MSKIKNNSQLSSAVAHNTRSIPVANANNEIENECLLGKNFTQVSGRLENRLDETGNLNHRKDAVKAVEFVMTASPEFFAGKTKKEIDDWTNENIVFIKQEIGAENILQFVIHFDEKTPHIHVLATPITQDGRLSCKELYGGRAKLTALQNRYAEHMSIFGLERGKAREKTSHRTIKEYYELVNRLSKLDKSQLKKLSEIIDCDCDQDTYKLLQELNYQQAKKQPPKLTPNAQKRKK